MQLQTNRIVWLRVLLAVLALVVISTPLLAAPKPPAPVAEEEKGDAAPQKAEANEVAAPAEDDNDFIQFINDKKGGGTLRAAIVTYENKKGVKVTLISALHVGEASYYDTLSKSFPNYDALLYEMVKPKGAPAPKKGAKSGSAVGGVQRFMKNVLELDYQLDDIDYTAKNFVHADMDWETFEKMQTDRGESIFSLMMKSMMTEMQRQNEGKGGHQMTMFDLLGAMMAPDSARQYKLLLAQQFSNIEAQMAGMDGPNGSVILTERNKKALSVLKETIKSGKKDIGVFYGAAHMTGMSKVLVDDMGFKQVKKEWVTAWDMTAKPGATTKRVVPAAPVEGEQQPAEEPAESK